MNIKRLATHHWMHYERTLRSCVDDGKDYVRVQPVIGKEGIYMTNTSCWFECEFGAWTYPRRIFQYELSLHNASELNARQVAALQEIVAQRLSTKEQRTLLRHAMDHEMCRNTFRRSRIWAGRFSL